VRAGEHLGEREFPPYTSTPEPLRLEAFGETLRRRGYVTAYKVIPSERELRVIPGIPVNAQTMASMICVETWGIYLKERWTILVFSTETSRSPGAQCDMPSGVP
jgi:hypothetical protein